MLSFRGVSVFSRIRQRRLATQRIERPGREERGVQSREELDSHARRELEEFDERARAVALDPAYLVPDVSTPPPEEFAEGSTGGERRRDTPTGFYDAPTNPYVPPIAAAPTLFLEDEEEPTARVIVDEEALYAEADPESAVQTAPIPRITWRTPSGS